MQWSLRLALNMACEVAVLVLASIQFSSVSLQVLAKVLFQGSGGWEAIILEGEA